MSSYSQCYPTLRSQAGSDNNLLSKFPFICKLETMAEALSNSTVIGDSRKNPNGYTAWEMAEKICEYLDLHMDYNTGKVPSAVSLATNKYHMSQKQLWDTMSVGFYTINASPGYGATDITKTGNGHHYLTAPTGTGSTPSGTYHPNPTAATFSSTLYTSSFIEYVDTGLNFGVMPTVNTADTGITSDDIRGISWEVNGLKGTDTDGNDLNLTGWHYPMGVPGFDKTSIGHRTDTSTWLTSNEVASYFNPDSDDLIAQRNNSGFTGDVSLKEYGIGGSLGISSFVHYAGDAGFSNHSNSLTGGGSDVAPKYKFISHADPFEVPSPGISTTQVWSRAAGTGSANREVFDIYSMFSTNGDKIPVGADLTGIYDPNTLQYTIGTVDMYPVDSYSWIPTSAGSDGRISFMFDAINDEIETYEATGAGNRQSWNGVPYYELRVRYDHGGSTHFRTFNIPFHYLAEYNLVASLGTSMGIALENEAAGITGDCTVQYTQTGGSTTTATGRQGPFSVDTMSVLDGGAGYNDGETITVTFPVSDGRHYQRMNGGALLSERSNNNPTIKNEESKATATSSNASALPRPIDILIHGNQTFNPNPKDYLIRGFLGTDYIYEKDEYARRYILDGNNAISGIDLTNGTDNATQQTTALAVPGYEYSLTTYHDEQNPHGYRNLYMDIPEYQGEADIRSYSLATGSFDIAISNGRVTGFTGRSRDDAEGTACIGGWGYNSNADYSSLTFIVNPAVSFPSTYIEPKIYIRTNTAADNGLGNKATIDINNADLEFYPGRDVPDNAFLYGMAYGSNESAYVSLPEDTQESEPEQWFLRNWGRGGIDPSSVRIQVERPVLTSTTRSLKSVSVGTGAHRYIYEVEYPPMSQDDAEKYIALFDEFKSNECVLFIPHNAVKHLGYYTYSTNSLMAKKPTVLSGGAIGSNEIVVDGFLENGSVPSAGTLFRSGYGPKTYKIVSGPNTADQYGRAEFLIEPPLVENQTNKTLMTDDGYSENGYYFKPRVYIMDDSIDYRVDAAGLYRLSPIKFREALN